MKKYFVLLALAIVLAVAAPVFAGPFSDVPENHWAYEALNKVAATGIVTGYNDGTFKGKNTLTRYEIAVIVSRILDKVAAERALMSEKVDALENGLTAGQAEDTIAIFKSLLAKEREKMIEEITKSLATQQVVVQPTTPSEPQQPTDPVVVLPENLTEQQAAEVAAIVEALSMEFKFELGAIGARLDAIEGFNAEANTRLTALEAVSHAPHNVTFGGEYKVVVNKTNVSGATPYMDPFKTDFDGDAKLNEAGYDYYTAKNDLYHKLTLNMGIATDNLVADLTLGAVTDRFNTGVPAAGLQLTDLFGTVTGDNFEATIGRDQANVMTSYLFGKNNEDNDLYNGIIVNVGDNTYALVKAYQHDADGVIVVDADDVPQVVEENNYLAIKQGLGLLNSTLYLGSADIIDSTDFIAGLNIPVSLLGVNVTTDVAGQKVAEDLAKYVAVNAKTSLGALNLEGNYILRDDAFTGILAKGIKSKGQDAKADMSLFGDKIALNARYWDHSYTKYGFGSDVNFGALTGNFDMEFANNDTDESNRTQAGVELNTKLAILDVNAGYKYDQFEDALALYLDDDDLVISQQNNAYGTLVANLFIPGLTATADYVYGLAGNETRDDEDNNVETTGLYTHEYELAYASDLLSAGFNYDLVGESMSVNGEVNYSIFNVGAKKGIQGNTDLTVWAGVNPAAYDVFGVSIDTVAGFKMKQSAETKYNYNVGVDVKKALNDKSNLTYGFVYDNREIAASGALTGLNKKHTFAVDYAVTADLKATVSYTDIDFTGVNAANTYKAQVLKTGLTLNF